MSHLTSRAYSGAPDLNLLLEFVRKAAKARWPQSTYKKVDDVVWAVAGPASNDDIRLWFDGEDLSAYGWFEAPHSFEFDIQPGLAQYDQIGDEILEWTERRREQVAAFGGPAVPKAHAMLGYHSVGLTMVLSGDRQRLALMHRHGFERTDGFDVLYSRGIVDPILAPKLDLPMTLRHVTDSDVAARVDLHRDAWSVWGPSAATVENYRRLRAAPIYDPELDVVLDDGSGQLLAYCIGWLDVANGFGHIEPVGCRTAFTGRGYARAVMLEAMRRMRARGMHTALVATASVNDRARALYPSCGFVEVERGHHYIKRVAL